jgi:EAL domain-containing protein (putative c-di-GMP-specific phosphodiesterase class I)
MAKSLNLKVTAEGVETQKQLNFLETKECDDVQGFYYSTPLNTEDMENFLKNKKLPDNPLSVSTDHRP